MVGGNGPAAPVLAGPVFQGKMKFKFYKKEVSNKSAGVIFGPIKAYYIKL